MASHETFDIPIGKVVGPKGDTGTGIKSIKLLSTSGLVKTYRITMTDDTTFDFVVTDGNGITGATFDAQTNALTLTFDNGTSFTTPSLKGTKGDTGNGISKIEKTGTDGLVDTYTVTYTDGQTFTYTVTNGADGVSPEVTVTQISGGHTVEIEDADGVKTFDVLDGEVTEARMAEALATKAPVILETVSGAIASFSDGADNMPVKKLVAQIEPVQDLHGYNNPWPAGGGANKFDGVWNGSSSSWNYAKNYIETEPNVTYYAYTPISRDSLYVYFYDADKNGLSFANVRNTTFTTPENTKFMRLQLWYDVTGYENIAINYPSSVTTYSPYSNICPISGWTGAEATRTGKNVLNLSEWENKSNNGITIGADAINIINKAYQETLNRYNVLNRSACVFSFHVKTIALSDSRALFAVYANGVRWLAGIPLDSVGTEKDVTITVPNGTEYISFGGWSYGGEVQISNLQLELGSTATAYEPYTGNQISVNWEDEAGTIYGGEDEVISGKLKSTMGIVDLGTISWTKITQFNHVLFYADIEGGSKKANFDGVCSHYLKSNSTHYDINYTFRLYGSEGYDFSRCAIRDDRYAELTGTQFAAAMSGVQLCYELAEPVEYTLTPQEMKTLYGANNIWSSTGDTEVEYPCDTRLFIERKIAEAVANVLNS